MFNTSPRPLAGGNFNDAIGWAGLNVPSQSPLFGGETLPMQ